MKLEPFSYYWLEDFDGERTIGLYMETYKSYFVIVGSDEHVPVTQFNILGKIDEYSISQTSEDN